jgi:hypothetical protein
MVVRLDIEIWVIGKCGTKMKVGMKKCGWDKNFGTCWVLWPLCMFGCISVAVVEGACVRDCRGLGLCTVGIVF